MTETRSRRRTFDDLERGCADLLDAIAGGDPEDARLQHVKRLCAVHDNLREVARAAAAAADGLAPLVAHTTTLATAAASAGGAAALAYMPADMPRDVLTLMLRSLLAEIDARAANELLASPPHFERRNLLESALCLRRGKLTRLRSWRTVCKRWRDAIDAMLDSPLCIALTKSRAAYRPPLRGVSMTGVRVARIVFEDRVGHHTVSNLNDTLALLAAANDTPCPTPNLEAVVLDAYAAVKSEACARWNRSVGANWRTLVVRAKYTTESLVQLWNCRDTGLRNLIMHEMFVHQVHSLPRFPVDSMCPTLESVALRGHRFPELHRMLRAPRFRVLITDAVGAQMFDTDMFRLQLRRVAAPVVVLCPGSRHFCPRTANQYKEQHHMDAMHALVPQAVDRLFALRERHDADNANPAAPAMLDDAPMPPAPPPLVIALDAASLCTADLICAKYSEAPATVHAHTTYAPDHVRRHWIHRTDYELVFARAAPAVASRDLHAWFRHNIVASLHPSVVLRVVEAAQLYNRPGSAAVRLADLAPASPAMPEPERQGAMARAAVAWLDEHLTYSPAFEPCMW